MAQYNANMSVSGTISSPQVSFGDLTTVTGTFTESLTVSGQPVQIKETSENAITGSDGITIVSGSSTTDVEGFRTEFVSSSGSLQTQIDAIGGTAVNSVNDITGDVLVTGTQNVTTQTLGQTITVTGPDLSSFATSAEVDSDIAAVSGTLSAEIDSDISTHAGISNAHHDKYTDAEAVIATETARFTMSGTLSTEIDTDISTHASITDAHHVRYADSEAISALEPTTAALAASGVATDANVATNVTDISDNTTLIVTTSGFLQSEIDSLLPEAGDVDSVNAITGAVLVTGTQNVTTQTLGQTITVTGPDLSSFATSAEVDSDIAAVSGTLSAEIDSDIVTHTAITNAHHAKYTDGEAVIALEPVTSALAASGVATDINVATNAADIATNVTNIDANTISGTVHAADVSAHHTRYSDSEAVVALEPITSELAASGVATDSQVSTNVTNISSLTTSGIAQDVFIAANAAEIITVSGHLQSEIDAVEGSDVDAITVSGLSDITGTIDFVGSNGVNVSAAGNTVTFDGAGVSGGGGGGTTNHAALSNLDFASAAHTGFASEAELSSASGTLSAEIDSDIATHAAITDAHHTRYTKEENDALTGSDGIVIVSGSNTIDVVGFRTEFVNSSGSLQSQIDTNVTEILDNTTLITTTSGFLQSEIDAVEASDVDSVNAVTGAVLVTGTQNVTTQTLGQTITVTGPDLSSFATSAEVDSDIVAVSGTLSSEIDSDIATHAAIADVHHVRYTKDENDAITGSDGITIVSGSNTVDVVGFRTEFVNTSGSLQSQIDAVEASDVDDVNSVTGSVVIDGAGEVIVTTAGQVITVSGTPDQSDVDSVNTVTGTLTIDGAGLVSVITDNSDTNSPTITISGASSGAGGGSMMLRWRFKSETTATNPGSNNFKLNNTSPAAATALYVSNTTQGGVDANTLLNALSSGDRIYIQNLTDSTEFILVTVSSVIDNTGWFTINITIDDDGGSSFTNNREFGWLLAFTGIADHGTLSGLEDDDHQLYTKADGSRGFSATVSGVDPVDSDDLSTKNYVDLEIASVSGTLSSEIDSDISTHTAISDAHHPRYTDSEAVDATESARFTMSGTLSAEIDSDITTHTAISNAHHDKYTDVEAIAALEPTTSELAASGVATDLAVTANTTLITTTSGHLQTQIDAVESSDVDSVNAITGAVLVTGTQNVTTQTLGQTITVTGPDLSFFATSAEVDSDIAAVSGTLSAEIDSDISTHTADASAHHVRYTKDENDAIIAGNNIVVVSGVDTITISSTAAGGVANALVGEDGITVTSGDPTDTISGFHTEFVNASGTLSAEIDADIITHSGIPDAHHARYTDQEAIDALEPTTSALTISGVLLREELVTVSGFLQSDINTLNLQDVYDQGNGIITTTTAKPFQVTGSGVITDNLIVVGDYEGLPKTIIIEIPSDADNISFFYTPVAGTVNNIIPTISGLTGDDGITWSIRYDSDRNNHSGATEVVTGGTNTHLGNSGNSITSFDNPFIPANSHIWIENTSISGTVDYLALTVLF